MDIATRMLLMDGGKFAPSSLFRANEQGVWYDPSDLTTLFQDAAGTTPVTAVEQPVGLMLDKSKGLVLGSELVTNGDFSNGTTGWTIDQSKVNVSVLNGQGVFKWVASANIIEFPKQKILYIGKFYRIAFDIISLNNTVGIFVDGIIRNVSTTGRKEFNVAATSTWFVIGPTTALNSEAVIDNISVREILGNHAYQSTSANRPTLSARYNLLTKTEDFSDAVWGKIRSSISSNVTTAPDGTLTADKFIASTVDGFHYILFGSSQAGVFTLSLYAKAAELNYIWAGDAGPEKGIRVNLLDGSFSLSSGYTGTVNAVGNGWYRIVVTGNISATWTGFWLDNGTVTRWLGDGTSGVYIWGADLRVANHGTDLPAYQRVNTSTDYDTTGFPPYLSFNGTSSCMATNSIDFTATDKMSVWAGVRKLSDAAGIIVELSAVYGAYNGAFNLITYLYYMCAENEGGQNTVRTHDYSGNLLKVISAAIDRAGLDGATTFPRFAINGTTDVAQYEYAGNSGGNFGNYPLYIGARNQSSLFFTGYLYSLIVRGAQSTDTQITNTEKWVNNKVGKVY